MQVKYLRIWLLSLFSLALVPMALAAADFSVILSPFANWSYMDYENYQLVWDIIILMLFFGLITKQILEERLGKKAAPVIGIVLGVILALWMNKVGLSLMDMGPWVAGLGVVIFCALVFLLFEKLSGTDKKARNVWIAMVVGQILLTVVLNASFDGNWSDNSAIGVVYSILTLANIIGAIWFVGKNFFNMFGGASTTPTTPTTTPAPAPITTTITPNPIHPLVARISEFEQRLNEFRSTSIESIQNLSRDINADIAVANSPQFVQSLDQAVTGANSRMVNIIQLFNQIRADTANYQQLTEAERARFDADVITMTSFMNFFLNAHTEILTSMRRIL